MMEIILFWMTGALISGFLCRLLSLPISIGFIATGYFFVKVDLHDKSDILEIPSELGIALLLFSLGLKLKPSYFLSFLDFFHSVEKEAKIVPLLKKKIPWLA